MKTTEKEITVIKEYYVDGVKVPTIEDYLRFKKADKTFKESDLESRFVKYMYNDSNKEILNPDATPMEVVLKLWNKLKPYTKEEVAEKFGKTSEVYKGIYKKED